MHAGSSSWPQRLLLARTGLAMKFYIMRLYEQDIQRFGSANWCSTAFG